MNEQEMDRIMRPALDRAGIAPAPSFEEMCDRLDAGPLTAAVEAVGDMGDLAPDEETQVCELLAMFIARCMHELSPGDPSLRRDWCEIFGNHLSDADDQLFEIERLACASAIELSPDPVPAEPAPMNPRHGGWPEPLTD